MKGRIKSVNETSSRLSVKEFFELFWINLAVSFRNTVEFFKVAFKYYGNWQFLKEDVSLRLMYLFHSPFTISKRFLMNRGEADIYAYGETPLTTLELIAKEAGIGPKDRVVELGSGRGRNCFWLNSFIGCPVVGIEYVPEFIERANRIKRKLNIPGVEFGQADYLRPDTDLKGGTVYYLYGTNLSDPDIEKLVAKFAKMPSGTKIITVSYPLTEYVRKPTFEILKHFTASFTWGDADVYLQVVV